MRAVFLMKDITAAYVICLSCNPVLFTDYFGIGNMSHSRVCQGVSGGMSGGGLADRQADSNL